MYGKSKLIMVCVCVCAGMKKFEYKGKQWHDECFICAECNQPIGNKSFIPRDERVICVPCYESNYAQKCSKCSGVSPPSGVSRYHGDGDDDDDDEVRMSLELSEKVYLQLTLNSSESQRG